MKTVLFIAIIILQINSSHLEKVLNNRPRRQLCKGRISSSIGKSDSPSSSATEASVSTTAIPSSIKILTTTSIPQTKENDFASALPQPPVCGVSQGAFSRVVGGNDANAGDFPWVALVAYHSIPPTFTFKCGASLITSQHALTAGHCIYGYEDRIYFVRLGEVDLGNHNTTKPVDVLVKAKIKHEEYNSTYATNDIGVLVFYRKVIFTDFIKPICLPLSEDLRSNNFVNYRPFIAGWGRTSYGGPTATHLQMLQLPVVSEESCREAYKEFEVIIDKRVICAGGMTGKDACNGDSGGPLMQPIWDSKNYTTYFYLTGIVSLGVKCGTFGVPGVYTRVTEFIPWIQKHVLGTDS